MDFLKFDKSRIMGFLVSIIIFLLILILYTQTTLFEMVERSAIDFRFFLRDPAEASIKLDEGVRMGRINKRAREDIIILGIDENTIRSFSDEGIQWPFPWKVHAKFTNYVGSGSPLALFFDITFLDHKDGEKEFAQAIKKAGNVFLDYPFETREKDVKYKDQAQRRILLNKMRWRAPQEDLSPQLIEEVVPPTPDLARYAKGMGFANVFPDQIDHINRQMPMVIKYNGWYYPNIDLVLAMHYYGISKDDVEVKMGEYVKLKNIPRDKMAKPNDTGEILIPINQYGFMDINFIGGSGSFQHYSYNLFAVDGSLKGNKSLENKMVLVAAYEATGIATDQHQSPYGTTFGIEHHANALNTILNQDFLFQLDDFHNIAVMFILALFLGFFLPRISIIKSTLLVIAFSLVYILTSYIIFDFFSIINAMITPVIQTGFNFTLIITYRVLTEQKEKKYIRQTFSKFVSKTVVDDLLKHPDKIKLGGEKKILTVLFSDIRGFTSISEKLTPELLVEHLNYYLEAMTELVFKYDGTLDKYVGDEIMAFWGAPIEMENHAAMACRSALEQMEKLHKMNAHWIKEGKPELNIGIGLNTGDMVVGNMGSSSRMDYTLMGDNVNLGARLEGTNKVYKTNIIISEFTYEHVKDEVIVRELDLIKVKGKEKPVRIYELLAMKE